MLINLSKLYLGQVIPVSEIQDVNNKWRDSYLDRPHEIMLRKVYQSHAAMSEVIRR